MTLVFFSHVNHCVTLPVFAIQTGLLYKRIKLTFDFALF